MTGVSIITPAYQAQDFIARAVRSVLAQDHADWEMVIVSDDGQDYKSILRGQGIADPRLRFAFTGRIGAGPGAARNAGLDHAAGRIIAMLDADDEFLPGKLSAMLPKALEYGFCSCTLEYGDYGADGGWRICPLPQVVETEGPLAAAMYPRVNYSMNSMLVFDRQRLPMRWPEHLAAMEDLVFAMQAYDYVDAIYHCARPLHRYVRRAGSLSHSSDTPPRFIQAKQAILVGLDPSGPTNAAARDSLRAFIEISLAVEQAYAQALQRGETPVFSHMLASALTTMPKF